MHQYKNIAGPTAVGSLEAVIRHYIKTTEERVESARGELEKVVLDFEDLEASETPEGYFGFVMVAHVQQSFAHDGE